MIVAAEPKREAILAAARRLLTRDGLERWSTERVARDAGVAKGLVHYHFRGRAALLGAVAAALVRHRMERRTHALDGSGTEALDDLWRELVREAASGECRASLSLSALPDRAIRTALEPEREALQRFGAAVGRALSVDPLSADDARATLAILDGLAAALFAGAPDGALRNGFDRWWLALLPA